MTEHEKLKKICDTIGYSSYQWKWSKYGNFFFKETDSYITDPNNSDRVKPTDVAWVIIDVREIIFTQEFRNKFCLHIIDLNIIRHWVWWYYLFDEINDNLDNPVDYLYDLIFKDLPTNN